MTCLTGKLKDIPCILCQQTDQVYIGHGKARFCAHCSITWDPTEDDSPIEGKSVIFTDDAVDGQLSEDILGRMGVLAGDLNTVFAFEDRLTEVMSIPEILFTENGVKKAEGLLIDYEADLLPLPVRSGYQKVVGPSWQEMVAGFSKVMALVHLAMRMNDFDIESLYDEMFKARKAEFDDAVSDYLAQMDCGGKAYLKAGPEMKLMKAQSRLESKSIANTYNRDLAKAILDIRKSVSKANRHTYVSQLRTWEAARRIWKLTQISLHTIMTSRDQALKAFSDRNGLTPDVELYPKQAAESVCLGWINRGIVSYQVAKNNPSPYHVGCLHYWRPTFTKGDCENLWTG